MSVDLPETLLAEVRAVADRRGLTMSVVFEESLRAFVKQDESHVNTKPFRLAHTVVKGRTFPSMSLAEMLEATTSDRLRE